MHFNLNVLVLVCINIVFTLDWITETPSHCGIQVTFRESYSLWLNSFVTFKVLQSFTKYGTTFFGNLHRKV